MKYTKLVLILFTLTLFSCNLETVSDEELYGAIYTRGWLEGYLAHQKYILGINKEPHEVVMRKDSLAFQELISD